MRRRDEDEFREFANARIAGLRKSAYLPCGDAHRADEHRAHRTNAFPSSGDAEPTYRTPAFEVSDAQLVAIVMAPEARATTE
jgi:hypothetical protein